MNTESASIAERKRSAELALYSQATDVAGLCRDIVLKTAVTIGKRKFVPVEAWTTIAVAHGCIASIKEGSVQEVYRGEKLLGVRAIAEIKRQADGAILTTAEGFVGDDEVDWYGSHGVAVTRWNHFKKCEEEKIVEKRGDYAIRAMAQTRAVSRACRTAFSHVVVLMNAGLSTTPLEEVADPESDRDHEHPDAVTTIDQTERREAETRAPAPKPKEAKPVEVPREVDPGLREQFRDGKWEKVEIHFGQKKGTKLGELTEKNLAWWIGDWHPKPFGRANAIGEDDKLLRAALDVAAEETAAE